MSTQTKFKKGDFVRVAKFHNKADGHDYGNPKGMIGRVSHVEDHSVALPWQYKLELEGKAPELFYPDYFAEDELELVSTPSPTLADAVLAIAAREEREAKRLFGRADSGELSGEFMHRARSRAQALEKIAADLREAVGQSR